MRNSDSLSVEDFRSALKVYGNVGKRDPALRVESWVMILLSENVRLPKSSKQHVFFRATPSTTRGKLPVNHDGGYAANAVVFGLAGCLGLLHVVDHDFVRRASKPLNQFNGFLAGRATCAEDFDFPLCVHCVLLRLEFGFNQLFLIRSDRRCPLGWVLRESATHSTGKR